MTSPSPGEPARRSHRGLVSKILGGNLAAMACGLVTTIILARWLGPVGQGLLAVLVTYPMLAQQIAEMGIRQAVARAIAQRECDTAILAGTIMALWLVSGVLGMTCTFAILQYSGPNETSVLQHVFAAALLPLLCMQSYAGGVLIGSQRVLQFGSTRWIPALAQLIAISCAAALAAPSLTIALGVRIAGLTVAATLMAVMVFRAFGYHLGRPNWRLARMLGAKGMAYGTAMFLVVLNYRMSLLLLNQWSDHHQAGLFSVAQQLVELLWQVPAAFGTVVFAQSLAARNGEEPDANTDRALRRATWLSAAAAAFAVILSPWLVPLTLGAAYAGSIDVLIALLPGAVAMVAFKIGRFSLVGEGRPWRGMSAVITGTFINVVIAFFTIPEMGALGAAFACSAGFMATGIIFHWDFRRNRRNHESLPPAHDINPPRPSAELP